MAGGCEVRHGQRQCGDYIRARALAGHLRHLASRVDALSDCDAETAGGPAARPCHHLPVKSQARHTGHARANGSDGREAHSDSLSSRTWNIGEVPLPQTPKLPSSVFLRSAPAQHRQSLPGPLQTWEMRAAARGAGGAGGGTYQAMPRAVSRPRRPRQERATAFERPCTRVITALSSPLSTLSPKTQKAISLPSVIPRGPRSIRAMACSDMFAAAAAQARDMKPWTQRQCWHQCQCQHG